MDKKRQAKKPPLRLTDFTVTSVSGGQMNWQKIEAMLPAVSKEKGEEMAIVFMATIVDAKKRREAK